MPASIGGALAFVVLLLPGICYVARLERGVRPSKSLTVSAFRETAAVVFASVILLLITSLFFAGARALWPQHTPDVGAMERDWHRYLITERQLNYTALWALALVGAACALGFFVARFDLIGKLDDLVSDDQGSRSESAWWSAFQTFPKTHYNYLYCRLEDGTEVEGPLSSYNPSPDENDDRSLQVVAPYTVRDPGGLARSYDAGLIILSARRMLSLRVVWFTPEELQEWTGVTLQPERSSASGDKRLLGATFAMLLALYVVIAVARFWS